MMKKILVGLSLAVVSVLGLSKGLAAAEAKIFDASQNIASSDDAPSVFEELQRIRSLGCQDKCTRQTVEIEKCDSKVVRAAELAFFGDFEGCMSRCMESNPYGSHYGGDHGAGDAPPPSK